MAIGCYRLYRYIRYVTQFLWGLAWWVLVPIDMIQIPEKNAGPMWSPPARLLLAMSRQPRHQRRRAEGHDDGRWGHVEGEAQSIAEGQELGGVEVHLGKSWKTMGKIVIFDEKTMGQLLILSENHGENCNLIGKP